MKRLFFNLGWAKVFVLAAALAFAGCSDEDETEYDTTYQDLEQELFDKYMLWLNSEKELGLTLSDDGTYYYKFDDSNSDSGTATNGDECWVRYDITSRNLTGDYYNGVNQTTDEDIALNQQSFSYYTHYVPTLHELDEADSDYDSALDLIMRANAITAGYDITIYAPSSLSYGLVNTSGYTGTATLSTGESFYSDINIKEVITDIDTWEQNEIDTFLSDKTIFTKATDLDDDSEIELYYYSSDDPNDVTLDFLDELPISYPYSYLKERKSIDDLDAKIKSILQSFTEGEIEDAIDDGSETNSEDDTKLADLTDDLIGKSDDSRIWYVGRLLDGFIFDSNIDNISGLMFNDYDSGSVLTYNVNDDGDTYIEAFYHMIPKMKYGTWNVVLTSSSYAYDSSGITGSSTSTNIKPYTPLIFYIYIEPDN